MNGIAETAPREQSAGNRGHIRIEQDGQSFRIGFPHSIVKNRFQALVNNSQSPTSPPQRGARRTRRGLSHDSSDQETEREFVGLRLSYDQDVHDSLGTPPSRPVYQLSPRAFSLMVCNSSLSSANEWNVTPCFFFSQMITSSGCSEN